ncbi:plasmid mobilization relaxosome protein MobC [Granulicatella sp. 19428wC4_WM01]|uniref:plasmid mobilization relaxosome protein MobC n=1 Tax=unclassified Granulicatella TaxID=2630493 RepID=UPI00351C35A3
MNRIGVNINQIVKRIHETESEIRQDDFMEMIQLQKQSRIVKPSATVHEKY